MLETNYKKLYATLYLKQVPFASYMKDGNYVVEYKDNVIVVSNDNCYLNGGKCPIETLLSII